MAHLGTRIANDADPLREEAVVVEAEQRREGLQSHETHQESASGYQQQICVA